MFPTTTPLFSGLFLATSLLASQPADTLANLQTAYEGESNARAAYLAYADKAQAEGHGKAASLFRAAAKAEEIHAANHAEVIKALGAQPQATIRTPEVKSTRENLEAALHGETYERDVMYPGFLAQARHEGRADAVRSLNFAKTAEAEHAILYTAALNELSGGGSAPANFYVCPVCGFTSTTRPEGKCPSSFTPSDRFIVVS